MIVEGFVYSDAWSSISRFWLFPENELAAPAFVNCSLFVHNN